MAEAHDEPLSYKLKKAAFKLDTSVKTLRRACKAKLVRWTKVGDEYHIPSHEVRRIAEEGMPSPRGKHTPSATKVKAKPRPASSPKSRKSPRHSERASA